MTKAEVKKQIIENLETIKNSKDPMATSPKMIEESIKAIEDNNLQGELAAGYIMLKLLQDVISEHSEQARPSMSENKRREQSKPEVLGKIVFTVERTEDGISTSLETQKMNDVHLLAAIEMFRLNVTEKIQQD